MKKWLMVLGSLFVTIILIACSQDNQNRSKSGDQEKGIKKSFTGNVFLDSILPDKKYKFFHGSSSPDMSKMVVMVNRADIQNGAANGTTDLYMLDAGQLEQGRVKLLSQGQIVGDHTGPWEASLAFRSNWSGDGKLIATSGGDRMWIINAETLRPAGKKAKGDTNVGGQVHDALFTSDARYALMTLWVKANDPTNPANRDGRIQLYDAVNEETISEPVSVCNECHGHTRYDSALCGLDGNIDRQADGSYRGTIYVAGYGGHFAKVGITIDPQKSKPITVSHLDLVKISDKKFTNTGTKADGTSQYKFHDVRLDGETLYWSTYNTDEKNMVHYGKIDLATGAITDIPYHVDPRAKSPKRGFNKMPLYCSSGQTGSSYMPMTMSNEAYISIFPKTAIN